MLRDGVLNVHGEETYEDAVKLRRGTEEPHEPAVGHACEERLAICRGCREDLQDDDRNGWSSEERCCRVEGCLGFEEKQLFCAEGCSFVGDCGNKNNCLQPAKRQPRRLTGRQVTAAGNIVSW